MGIKGLTKMLADNAPMAMNEQKFESQHEHLSVPSHHLQRMFTRTIRLLEAGMKPVFVFHSQPPDLKKQELAKRYSKREDATKDLNAAIEAGDKEGIEKFSKRTVKWVLMTCSDDECITILKRCKEAIPTKENGGKAIIIDIIVDASSEGMQLPKLADVQLHFDMEMMVLVHGKQRTETEWKRLFHEAGFKEYKITPAMGARSIIEIYH